jgi:hypothetical protein
MGSDLGSVSLPGGGDRLCVGCGPGCGYLGDALWSGRRWVIIALVRVARQTWISG